MIPIELRIALKEQADVRIWVFSTDSYSSAELEMMSSSGDLDKQFQDMRQKGFADEFNGSLDIERIGIYLPTRTAISLLRQSTLP